MSTSKLVGCDVTMIVSDPWELVNDEGDNDFSARIVDADTYAEGAEAERLLIKLDSAVDWRGAQYDYLVVTHRRNQGLVDELLSGQAVSCSAVGVSASAASGSSPWGADNWRGGLAALAQITVVSGPPSE